MQNMFDRPGRRDRRVENVVALCASRSAFARGYTPAEHNRALDRLLGDLDLPADKPAPARAGQPDIVIRSARDEDDSRLRLAGVC